MPKLCLSEQKKLITSILIIINRGKTGSPGAESSQYMYFEGQRNIVNNLSFNVFRWGRFALASQHPHYFL